MQGIPYIDVDYCQFSNWGYQKPTRIWGSDNITVLPNKKCDGHTCPNLNYDLPVYKGHARRHKYGLGGNNIKYTRSQKGRWPPELVKYLAQIVWNEPKDHCSGRGVGEVKYCSGQGEGPIKPSTGRNNEGSSEHCSDNVLRAGYSSQKEDQGSGRTERVSPRQHDSKSTDERFPKFVKNRCKSGNQEGG